MEYKFKAWVKPVIENGGTIYTGCMVDVWEIGLKRRKIIYYEPFDLLHEAKKLNNWLTKILAKWEGESC